MNCIVQSYAPCFDVDDLVVIFDDMKLISFHLYIDKNSAEVKKEADNISECQCLKTLN